MCHRRSPQQPPTQALACTCARLLFTHTYTHMPPTYMLYRCTHSHTCHPTACLQGWKERGDEEGGWGDDFAEADQEDEEYLDEVRGICVSTRTLVIPSVCCFAPGGPGRQGIQMRYL